MRFEYKYNAAKNAAWQTVFLIVPIFEMSPSTGSGRMLVAVLSLMVCWKMCRGKKATPGIEVALESMSRELTISPLF